MLIFSILRSWKVRFSYRTISLHELCTIVFRVFGGQTTFIELK